MSIKYNISERGNPFSPQASKKWHANTKSIGDMKFNASITKSSKVLLRLFLFVYLLIMFAHIELFGQDYVKAFTHPRFFYSDCKCGMFNPIFFQLEIYKEPTDTSLSSWIIPPNFEVGYSVVIKGKEKDFFEIDFDETENPVHSQCKNCTYYVKKGTLGTWVLNSNDSTREYDPVPLYKESSIHSKIVARLKPKKDVVVLILDINGEWMYVKTMSKGRKKYGWLNPKMQFGDPRGAYY